MNQIIDQWDLYRLRTQRDAEAFGRIYDRYVTSIYRFVVLKVPTKEIAEDITSDTFLKFWNTILQNQEAVRNIRAYLYRIAKNLISDYYRKRSQDQSVTFSQLTTSTIDEGQIASDRSTQSRAIEARADLKLLLDQIDTLKEGYRDVLVLRLIDELSFSDIAKILDKKNGAVRVMYHRAMKALEQLTSQHE